MLREELRTISSTDTDLRRFSYVICGALMLIGAWRWWAYELSTIWFIIGAVILAVGLAYPCLLKPFQKIWMGFALVMGTVMTALILSLLFYLIVTPIGVIMRLFGKDILNRRIDRQTDSYWIDRTSETWEKAKTEAQY